MLESREMLSGLALTLSASDTLPSAPALSATSTTPTTLSTSWPAPVNGMTWNLSVAINGALLSGTPRTGTLTLASNGTVLASLNIANATPPAGTTGNSYTLTVPGGLPLGLNQLRIDYSGDANYSASAYTATLTIHNDNLSMSYSTQALIGRPYTVNVAIVGPLLGGAARTGTLSLVEGTSVLASADVAQATPNTNGYYPLVVSGGLSAGTHSLKVNYTGDAVYEALSLPLNVVSAVSALSTSTFLGGPAQVAAGQAATFTANVSAPGVPVDSGTVTLSEGTTVLGTVAVSSTGVATFSGINLALGSHALTASYSGATSFNASASQALNVQAVGALVSLGTSWPPPVAGQAWTVNVSLNGTLLSGAARTGTLTLTSGTTLLASVDVAQMTPGNSGYALTASAGLPLGVNTVKVVYSGDANYGSASSTYTLTVYNDALSLSYSTTALAGQPYTVNAAILGPLVGGVARTGTLSLVEGTSTLASVDVAQISPNASGFYALTVSGGLATGAHSMKVVYTGDAAYNALTQYLSTVNAVTNVATATSLSGPAQVAAGASATYTVRVSAAGVTVNAGTVTLLDGTTVLGTAAVNASGQATFQSSDLALGNHTLTARYDGASALNASTSNALNVSVVGAIATLSTNWPAPYANQTWTMNVALNGTLLAGLPRTGAIALTEGTTVLASVDIATVTPASNGYYALTIVGGLARGAHSMKLAYSGDANYGGATMPITFSVYNDSLSLSYTTAPLVGQPYTVNAAITGALVGGAARTGTLSLVEGTTTLASVNITQVTPNSGGYYPLTVSAGLAAGSHTLKVLYSGDAVYDALSFNLNTITPVSALATSTGFGGPTTVVAGQAATFTANVTAPGTPVNAGAVTLREGTTVLGVAAVGSTGQATFQGIALTPGSHALTASYGGTTSFTASTSPVLNVNAVGALTSLSTSWPAPYAGQTWTINVALNGTLLAGAARTGVITLVEGTTVLGSVDITKAAPSSSGYYPLTVTGGLSRGLHAMKLTYSGDANYGGATMSITLSVYNDSLSLSYSTTPLVGQSYTVNAAITGALVGGAARTGTLSLVEGTTTLVSVDVAQAKPNASGYYPLTVSGGLAAGTHSLKVLYSGDAVYDALSCNLSPVNPVSTLATTTYLTGPSSVVAGQNTLFTANVSALGAAVNAGTVTFLDGTTMLGTAAVNATGTATLQTAALTAGRHSLTARYSGATTFNSSVSQALSVNVIGATTTLLTSWPAPYSGQPWNMSVAISGALLANTPRTGVITLTEGTTVLGSVDIAKVAPNSSGYYPLAVAGGLAAGPHSMKLTYSGDANYGGATTSISFTVYNDSLSLSYSTSPLIGQPYTVNAAITGPLLGAARTGTLTLVEGTATLASVDVTQATPNTGGYYALLVSGGLSAGPHSLKVLYSGDALYNALSFNLSTINPVSTLPTSTYLSGPTQVVAGQAAAFTVSVSAPGAPVTAGTVTLLEGTAVLGTATVSSTGVASFPVISLAAGSHVLTASYGGAPSFNPSASAALNVKAVGALVSFGTSWSPLVAGQAWTMNVSLNGTLLPGTPRTGTLTLTSATAVLASVDITQVASGVSTYALTVPGGLPTGVNTIKLSYSGDANYGSASSTYTLTVYNDALSLSYSSTVLAGQPYTVNAAIVGPLVGGAARTGTLSLLEGATTLASIDVAQAASGVNGYYPLTVSGGLAAGAHSLKVVYSGDAVYNALNQNLAAVNAVASLATATTLSGPAQIAAGVSAAFTARVSASGATVSGGTVTFLDGTSVLGTAAVNTSGVAIFQTSALALGNHTLTARYEGVPPFKASTSAAFNVSVVGAVTTLATNWPAPYTGQTWTMNVALNGTLLTGVPRTGTLSLTEGTTVLASVDIAQATPSSSGYYALSVAGGLSSGLHSMKLVYSGDASYGGATMSITLTVRNDSLSLSYSSTALVGQPYTVNAAITGALVGGAVRTGALSLIEGTTTLASVNITQVTPSASGFYPLTVSGGLAAGSHSLKVLYSGDTIYDALSFNLSTVNAVSNVATSTYLSGPTTTVAGQSVTFTASVSAQGATVNTGTVTLREGTAVLGTAAVSSTGLATFTGIALTPGNHALTAGYDGTTSFNPSTSATLNVKTVNALTSLGCSWSTPLAGQSWALRVVINGAAVAGANRTGTLTLSSGSTVLATVDVTQVTPDKYGYYSLAVPGGLPLGVNVLKVVYSGDANYAGSSTSLTLNVANVGMNLAYSTSVVAGQPFAVNATLTGPLVNGVARTGTLTLMEGTTVLATIDITKVITSPNGSLPLVIPGGLSAGTHSLKLVYSGDAVYSSLTVSLATITATLPA